MSQPVVVIPQPRDRGVPLMVLGAVGALVAALGSLAAWSSWIAPLTPKLLAHTYTSVWQQVISGSTSLSQLDGSIPIAHGLNSTQGMIGVFAAIALVLSAVLFAIPGRVRLVAGPLALVAGLVLTADGVIAFVAAIDAANTWGGQAGLLQLSYASPTWWGSGIPSAGAAIAGLFGFFGGIIGANGVANSARYRRDEKTSVASLPVQPVAQAWTPPGIQTSPTPTGSPQRRNPFCPDCGSLNPAGAPFCGNCGGNITARSI